VRAANVTAIAFVDCPVASVQRIIVANQQESCVFDFVGNFIEGH